MGIAQDLLTLAGRLASPAPTEPEQASLRRSISTAYYALFHLLVQEAVQNWNGSSTARIGLERKFEHKTMKDVSNSISRSSWRGWSTPSPAVPPELEAVARVFTKLQESRQQADYDNAKIWALMDAEAIVADAQFAFDNWIKIRTLPAATEYLLSLLIGNKPSN
jgi:uncharacterized protein (UPF0332 family)